MFAAFPSENKDMEGFFFCFFFYEMQMKNDSAIC